MYSDPTLIRTYVTAVRWNKREKALVRALVDYIGGEEAAFVRDLVLKTAVEVLHASDSDSARAEKRAV